MFFGGSLNLEPVFISASEKHGLVPQQAMPSGDCVSSYCCVRMTDVRGIIHVEDGRSDVERTHQTNRTAIDHPSGCNLGETHIWN